MKMTLQAMGKTKITELGREDLVSLNSGLARNLQIGYAGEPPAANWGTTPLAAK